MDVTNALIGSCLSNIVVIFDPLNRIHIQIFFAHFFFISNWPVPTPVKVPGGNKSIALFLGVLADKKTSEVI